MDRFADYGLAAVQFDIAAGDNGYATTRFDQAYGCLNSLYLEGPIRLVVEGPQCLIDEWPYGGARADQRKLAEIRPSHRLPAGKLVIRSASEDQRV